MKTSSSVADRVHKFNTTGPKPVKPLGSQARAARHPLVQTADAQFVHVPVALISPDPRQPRKIFAPQELHELAASITEKGVLEPLLVRPDPAAPAKDPRFLLVAGERRYHAAILARKETVPVIVRHKLSERDVLEIQIIENLQRESLNPLEEAAGYDRLVREFGVDRDTIADDIGKSLRYVHARLQLLKLTPPIKEALAAGEITADTALAIHTRPAAEHLPLLDKIRAEAARLGAPLSVRAAKQVIAPEPVQASALEIEAPEFKRIAVDGNKVNAEREARERLHEAVNAAAVKELAKHVISKGTDAGFWTLLILQFLDRLTDAQVQAAIAPFKIDRLNSDPCVLRAKLKTLTHNRQAALFLCLLALGEKELFIFDGALLKMACRHYGINRKKLEKEAAAAHAKTAAPKGKK